MSKSKGNGVVPASMAVLYGVDALRAAILFGAPPESDLNFDENALASMQTFLSKTFKLCMKVTDQADCKDLSASELQSLVFESREKEWTSSHISFMKECLSLLVDFEQKVGEHRLFHVAVARLMELANKIQKRSSMDDKLERQLTLLVTNYLVHALYPIAPHMACELWA